MSEERTFTSLVISQKLHAQRSSVYNSSEHMDAYVELCDLKVDLAWAGEEFDLAGRRNDRYDIGQITHVITSDDIFKALLHDRVLRDQTLMKSRMLLRQYNRGRGAESPRSVDLTEVGNYDKYMRAMDSCKKRASGYLREKLGEEAQGMSNGENSFVICPK